MAPAGEREPHFSFHFSISASLEITSKVESAPHQSPSAVDRSLSDSQSLTPVTRKLQQQIRDKARDRAADAQSLRALEVGTAKAARQAKRDKVKDRMSLALLEFYSREDRKRREEEDSGMLTSPDWQPTLSRVKGVNGKPLSEFPSFSTTNEAQSWDKLPSPNGQLQPITEESPARGRSRRRRSLTIMVDSRASPQPKNNSVQSMLGEDGKKKVDEVLSLIDSIGVDGMQGDAGDAAMRAGLTEAMETLLQSPMSSIKHLPGNYCDIFKSTAKQRGEIEGLEDGNPWRSSDGEIDHETEAAQPSEEDSRQDVADIDENGNHGEEGEDEWEVV